MHPNRGMIYDIDVDAKISLVDETQRLDDDLIFDTTADHGGEEVVVKPAETGVSDALDVDPVTIAAKELTDNDMTMAEALAELRTSKPKVVTTVPILNSATTVTTTKPKAKGITIHEPSVTQKIAELAARMTLVEHEKYIVEERARMLAEFIKNRKKQLVVERAEAIRSKPPIKSQLRNLMMTYLKNIGRFTHAQLKHRDFEQIQGLYNKEKELVDTFVHNGSEEDERRIKDLNTKVPNEEEALLNMKFLTRADGSSRYIKTFTEMVSKFDRMDFLELHSLMMQRFKTTTLEGIDLILWGDLKTMFEANAVDKLWKNQED
ncbi:hypothetical protein Tco_1116206 [Tanacetum coccineum]